MAPDGQGTVTLCGQCIMEHIANDIMFGFVANSLEVPFSIQLAGAHYAEYSSYGELDPLASQGAYAMGNRISEAMTPGGALSIGDFCSELNAASLVPQRIGFWLINARGLLHRGAGEQSDKPDRICLHTSSISE